MEFACHTWGFNDLLLPEALGTIARMGFRYVDIGTGPHLNAARAAAPQTREASISEVKGDLALYHLHVSDLYLMLPRISIDDEAKRQTDMLLFKALLPFARGISAPGITVSPGLVHPDEDEEAWERMVSALREMLVAAQAARLALSIEPHLDSMVHTPARTLRLLEDVPGLQITLDWAHFVCQRFRLKDIAPLLPHTRHVHIRQAAPGKLQVPMARGRIDLAEVLTALRDAQYQGFVCVEVMQTVDWHGMMKVNSLTECSALRNSLRTIRDQGPSLTDRA